jgi:hypothetical protein
MVRLIVKPGRISGNTTLEGKRLLGENIPINGCHRYQR